MTRHAREHAPRPEGEGAPAVPSKRLLEIATAINGRLQLEDVLQLIAKASLELAGSQRAVIWQLNADDGGFERPVTAVESPAFAWHPRPPRVEGLTARTVREAHRTIASDENGSKVSLRQDDAKLGIRHVVGVPLRAGEAVIGVLAAGTTRQGGYQPEHLAALDVLADQAAIALQNARLYEEAQRRAGSLQSLAEAGAALQQDLEPQAILRQLCQGLGRVGLSCMVGRLTSAGDAFVVEDYVVDSETIAALEQALGRSLRGATIPVAAAPAAQRLVEGEASFARDLVGAGVALFPPEMHARARELLTRLGLEKAVVAPLRGKRAPLGGVLAFGPTLREEDVPLVATFARQAAMALENAALVQALAESEARYRTIVEHSPAGICIEDGQQILYASQRFAELLGGSADALGTMEDLLARVPMPDRQHVRDIMHRHLTGREAPNRFEARFELADGRIREFDIRAGRLTFDGRPASLALVLDVTDVKQAQEAVLRERQRLYRILNNMLDPVLVIDTRYTIRFMNRAAKDRFGDQVGAVCYQAVMGRACACQPCALNGVLASDDERFRCEMAGRGDSWWEITATPMQLEDANAIVSVVRDVTERKRALEALRASELERRIFMESAADLMATLDADGRFRYLNRAACETLGGTTESLLGRSITEFVAEADRAALDRAQERLAESGQAFVAEINMRQPDDTLVPCQLNIVGIFGPDGGYQGCHLVARDVREQKRLQQELLVSHRLAALGELSAGIAHEFNNLTAAMSILAELALQTEHPEIVKRALHNVVECCEQGGEVTRNLLAFARPSQPDRKATPITQCVRRALALADMELRNARVAVTADLSEEPPPVLADARQIEEACLNIVLNACHAMPNGGTLTITASSAHGRLGSEGPELCVQFRDTGIGIPADDLECVFDPFFTTKGVLGEPGLTGLGLGLSVARSIVRAHGGALTVESQEGQGTAFSMWLPLSPVPLPEMPLPPDGAAEHEPLPPLRILVAEDEAGVRRGLAELLRVEGHTVVEAGDGHEALAALRSNDLDLALVDLVMPAVDGRALLDAFGGAPPCPVVIITGRGGEGDAEGLTERGAAGLLIKPFQARQLMAALERAFHAA